MNGPTLIVDGSYLMYRAYHQKASRELRSSDGIWTGGAYVFLKSLKYTIDALIPSRMVVVWDGAKSARRMRIYPEYKANRHKLTEIRDGKEVDIRGVVQAQIEMLEPAFRYLGVRVAHHHQMEGDDLIYLLAILCPNSVIVSEDKDMLSMVTKTTSVYRPMKGEQVTYDSFIEQYGYEPRFHVINRAIVGDISDNIPGVKGAGEKSAATFCRLVQTLGTKGAVREVQKGGHGKRLQRLAESSSIEVLKRNLDLMDCSREEFSHELVEWARAVLSDGWWVSQRSFDSFLMFCNQHEFNSLMGREWYDSFEALA